MSVEISPDRKIHLDGIEDEALRLLISKFPHAGAHYIDELVNSAQITEEEAKQLRKHHEGKATHTYFEVEGE